MRAPGTDMILRIPMKANPGCPIRRVYGFEIVLWKPGKSLTDRPGQHSEMKILLTARCPKFEMLQTRMSIVPIKDVLQTTPLKNDYL